MLPPKNFSSAKKLAHDSLILVLHNIISFRLIYPYNIVRLLGAYTASGNNKTKCRMSKIRKQLDAKIKMFKAISALYLTYKARFDVIPAMAATMTSFNNQNVLIDDLVPLAIEDTKPITDQRDALRLPLYLSATVVAKALYAYADSIGDYALKGEVNWTISKLEKLPLDQLGPNCDAILKRGEVLLALAGPFGLDQDKLDKLEADNIAWIAKESGTRNKQVSISEDKRRLAKHVSENMSLLSGRLDGMVYTLSETDDELVGLWNQTRILVDFPVTETQAKVVVKQKLTDTFIYNAEVLFENGTLFRSFTDINGEAIQKPIKQGNYLFRVLAAGYKPYSIVQQRLYKGRINRFTVELEPEV